MRICDCTLENSLTLSSFGCHSCFKKTYLTAQNIIHNETKKLLESEQLNEANMTKHNLGKVSLNLKLFDSEFRLFDGKEETNPSKAKQKEAQYGFHQLILSTSARKKSDCS